MHDISDTFTERYSREKISNSELFYGEGLHSFGGLKAAKFCLADIPPGHWVLDVGCGLGAQVDILKKQGCHAYGLDISVNMVEMAKERYIDLRENFSTGNILDLPNNFLEKFDTIFTRDTFLYLSKQERQQAFMKCIELLNGNAGNQLVLYDWGMGKDIGSAFRQYCKSHEYDLDTLEQYRERLENSGWQCTQSLDITDRAEAWLQENLKQYKLHPLCDSELVQHVTRKLSYYKSGELKWLKFHCVPFTTQR